MSLHKLAAVARREYVETVKTKAFLLGILLMPGFIIGMIFLSAKVTAKGIAAEGPIRVAILDHTGRVAAEMVKLAGRKENVGGGSALELEPVQASHFSDEQLRKLKQRVHNGSLFGVLEVPADIVQGQGNCVFYTRGSGLDQRAREVRQLLNAAVRQIRFADAGLDPERVEELSRPVPVHQQDIREQEGRPSDQLANMMTPFFFVFLLFMGVFGVGQGLLTSVIEEKGSRVVEVLLSALSPFELMAGKILGMAGVGLTMVVLWSVVGYAAAISKNLQHLAQVSHLEQFILYYVLGYLLISSILAAVGSACNTLKEAQPMMLPLTLLLIIPMLFWMQIVNRPNSMLSVALTFVPPMTPFIMVLRLTSPQAGIPVWQQVFAPVWLAGWVVLTMWAAGRVFRVGLLMYGKPPSLRELVRWVGYR